MKNKKINVIVLGCKFIMDAKKAAEFEKAERKEIQKELNKNNLID